MKTYTYRIPDGATMVIDDDRPKEVIIRFLSAEDAIEFAEFMKKRTRAGTVVEKHTSDQ
jgi:hypothetical protein